MKRGKKENAENKNVCHIFECFAKIPIYIPLLNLLLVKLSCGLTSEDTILGLTGFSGATKPSLLSNITGAVV